MILRVPTRLGGEVGLFKEEPFILLTALDSDERVGPEKFGAVQLKLEVTALQLRFRSGLAEHIVSS